jgi:hypothetical protein
MQPTSDSGIRLLTSATTFAFMSLAEDLSGRFTSITPAVKAGGQLFSTVNPRSRVMIMASASIAA